MICFYQLNSCQPIPSDVTNCNDCLNCPSFKQIHKEYDICNIIEGYSEIPFKANPKIIKEYFQQKETIEVQKKVIKEYKNAFEKIAEKMYSAKQLRGVK